jgi:hypothetical protein
VADAVIHPRAQHRDSALTSRGGAPTPYAESVASAWIRAADSPRWCRSELVLLWIGPPPAGACYATAEGVAADAALRCAQEHAPSADCLDDCKGVAARSSCCGLRTQTLAHMDCRDLIARGFVQACKEVPAKDVQPTESPPAQLRLVER